MESADNTPEIVAEAEAARKPQSVATSAVKGMYQLFLGNTTYTVLLAITAIIVGRILGPSGYGLYTIALILPPFAFLTVKFGLDSAATRHAARFRSEGLEKEAVSFAYATTVVELAVSLVVALPLIWLSSAVASGVLNHPELGSVILPASMVSVIGLATYTMSTASFVGLWRYKTAAWFQVTVAAGKLVVSLGLILLGFGVLGAVVGYTASYLVSGLLGVALLLKMNGRLVPVGFKRDISRAARYGLPIYISVLASGIVAPLLNTLLARTVSNAQIGGYTAANTFTSLIGLFTYPIATVLFPLFSRKVEDKRQLTGIYETATRFTALLVIPVTAFIMAFSMPLIETIYSQAYSFSAGYLTLLATINLMAGLGSLAWGAFLNGVGSSRAYFEAAIIGSALSVALGVALIPSIGVYGAITGQLVGQALSLAIGTWLIGRRFGVRPRLFSVWKIYLAAGATAAVCYPLSFVIPIPELATLVGAIAFVAIFIPVLALLRALSQEDLSSLRRYFGPTPLLSRFLEFGLDYYQRVASVRR